MNRPFKRDGTVYFLFKMEDIKRGKRRQKVKVDLIDNYRKGVLGSETSGCHIFYASNDRAASCLVPTFNSQLFAFISDPLN
jgi:hypothetical protein